MRGLWGGSKAAVQDVLSNMLDNFARLYARETAKGKEQLTNFDMAVLNDVILQEAARSWKVFTGRPFCGGQVRLA